MLLVLGDRRPSKHRLGGALEDRLDLVVIQDGPKQSFVLAWKAGRGAWLTSRQSLGDRVLVDLLSPWWDNGVLRASPHRILTVELKHLLRRYQPRDRRPRRSRARHRREPRHRLLRRGPARRRPLRDSVSTLVDGHGRPAGVIRRSARDVPEADVATVVGQQALEELDPELSRALRMGAKVPLSGATQATWYRFRVAAPPTSRVRIRPELHRGSDPVFTLEELVDEESIQEEVDTWIGEAAEGLGFHWLQGAIVSIEFGPEVKVVVEIAASSAPGRDVLWHVSRLLAKHINEKWDASISVRFAALPPRRAAPS